MSANNYFSIKPVSGKEAGKIILVIAGIILFNLLYVYFSPLEHLFAYWGINSVNGCPLLTFTSIPCPFCGMGSIFKEAVNLNFKNIFYHNPLGIVFYIISGLIMALIIILSLIKRKIVLGRKSYRLIWLPVGFIFLMWILNILYGHHP